MRRILLCMHLTYDDEVKTPGYSCPTNAAVCIMCTLSVFTVFSVLIFVAVTLITYLILVLIDVQ